MAERVRAGGRAMLKVLVVGGDDLRQSLVTPGPGGESGFAAAIHVHQPAVQVEVQELDVPPLPELVAGLTRDGSHGGLLDDDLDVVIISLLPHRQCSPEDVQAGMAALVERVQAASGAHVLVANVCTYGASDDPGSNGTPSPRLQLRRLNLALMELSQNLGISILDVDRLMTELGAARTCPQPFHLSPAGAASVAEEAARVLADYGFFEDRPLVAQVAREAE